MDQQILWLDNVMSQLFMFVWVGCVAAFFLLAWGLSSGRLKEAQVKPIVPVFIGTIAAYILSSGFLMAQSNRIARDRAERLFHAPHAYIEFTTFKPRRLTDPAEQRAFLALLDGGTEVAAHHSGPEHLLTFTFPGDVRAFALGKDSRNPDEYWLKMENAPEFAAEVNLRHFTSPALTEWLARRRSPR